jgi:hypothetical protein
MLKVVENYTLRRGLAVSASLRSRLSVCLGARLYVDLSAKAGCALVMPVLSRVAARDAMQEAP